MDTIIIISKRLDGRPESRDKNGDRKLQLSGLEVCNRKPKSNGLGSKGNLLAFLIEKDQSYNNDCLWFSQGFGFISLWLLLVLSMCWLYPQSGYKMTVVIPGFIFTHNIQRKGVFISSGGSLKSEETSFLKTPANLLSYPSVPSESQAPTNSLTKECHGLLGLG